MKCFRSFNTKANMFVKNKISFFFIFCAAIKTDFQCFFLKKWANPGLFFKHTLQFLQQINVKKCPSSMRCRNLNSRPLEHESPTITTSPGLQCFNVCCILRAATKEQQENIPIACGLYP